MPHFFVQPGEISDQLFQLKGDSAHHLIRVLRVKSHDPIFLFDGNGKRFEAIVKSVDVKNNFVNGQILKSSQDLPSRFSVRLLQGIPRGPKFDFVIEKSVELGVTEIIPFFSEKNPVVWEGKKDNKVERWERIVLSACEQSEHSYLPKIYSPCEFKELEKIIKQSSGSIILDPLADKGSLKKTFSGWFKDQNSERTEIFNIITGPESGFSPIEVKTLQNWGAVSTSLGREILRTETAGLAALAMFKYAGETI
ncbi:MAG: RsmE family RNA methyltransferase [Elusimicrobiota bacterium]